MKLYHKMFTSLICNLIVIFQSWFIFSKIITLWVLTNYLILLILINSRTFARLSTVHFVCIFPVCILLYVPHHCCFQVMFNSQEWVCQNIFHNSYFLIYNCAFLFSWWTHNQLLIVGLGTCTTFVLLVRFGLKQGL